jgi:hypothetical protein
MDDTKTNIKVTDVFKRLALRKNIGNFTTNYYERILSSFERPEVVAHMEYGAIDRHWIMMLVNNIEDPYFDWILDNEQLESFIAAKYPGKTIVFPTTHYTTTTYSDFGLVFPANPSVDEIDYTLNNDGGTDSLIIDETYTMYMVYGTDNFSNVGASASPSAGYTFKATGTTPTTWESAGSGTILYHNVDSDLVGGSDVGGKRFFFVGETVQEYGSSGRTGVTGVISELDATLSQVATTSGTFVADNYIKGDQSGAVGKISSVSDSIFAPHHYVNTDLDIVDRDVAGSVVVSNHEYENDENEKKRNINVLMEEFASRAEEELKVELNR